MPTKKQKSLMASTDRKQLSPKQYRKKPAKANRQTTYLWKTPGMGDNSPSVWVNRSSKLNYQSIDPASWTIRHPEAALYLVL